MINHKNQKSLETLQLPSYQYWSDPYYWSGLYGFIFCHQSVLCTLFYIVCCGSWRKFPRQVSTTLDPLLERLTRDFIDDADLSTRLQTLFRVTTFALPLFSHFLSFFHFLLQLPLPRFLLNSILQTRSIFTLSFSQILWVWPRGAATGAGQRGIAGPRFWRAVHSNKEAGVFVQPGLRRHGFFNSQSQFHIPCTLFQSQFYVSPPFRICLSLVLLFPMRCYHLLPPCSQTYWSVLCIFFLDGLDEWCSSYTALNEFIRMANSLASCNLFSLTTWQGCAMLLNLTISVWVRVQDIFPPIHLSESDFAAITQAPAYTA